MKNPYDEKSYAVLARQAAAEGIVLLKNDNNALPLAPNKRVALFGRAQFNYYKSGTGSGGLVNSPCVTGIREALCTPGGYICDSEIAALYTEWLQSHPFQKGAGWAQEPWFQEEMPLEEEQIRQASQRNDAAIVIIGRTAGEDQDNSDSPGSLRLTDIEETMLQLVCLHFKRSIVLLNTGNIIDMGWVQRYDPAAVAYVWQGGQEGGWAVRDVLTGAVCPSGRLTDTIAVELNDYPAGANFGNTDRNVYAEDIYVGYRYFETFAPDKVLYPFGSGLSYTQFSVMLQTWDRTADGIHILATVCNTGKYAGREVVQLYVSAPQGRMGKPARQLCAFAKSKTLAPGESETVDLSVPWKALASYDDTGVTGHRAAWILETGEYQFFLGGNVRSAVLAFAVNIQEFLVEQLTPAAGPQVGFDRLRPSPQNEPVWEAVPPVDSRVRQIRSKALPVQPCMGDVGLRLTDVAEKRATMQEFLAQFSDNDLCCLIRGEGMCSRRVTPGTAGAFGGVSDNLIKFGLPTACCSDGPSGIRMDCGAPAFSLPNGTCLACSFNLELSEELYSMEGLELRKNHIDTLLGPGMNLHRHPLNGRNFEYFSEDPLLTGKIAAAQLRGLNRWGVVGTIKHFACNNQETARHRVEALVSERALRELYLRGFEIALNARIPCAVMTAYNPMNGSWTASHYELVTKILREQWGFNGIVMSDWWAEGSDFTGPGTQKNVAAMVRAQNDLYMVASSPETNSNQDNLEQALKQGTLTRAELLRSAENICRFLINTPAFVRQQYGESDLEKCLQHCVDRAEQLYREKAISVEASPETQLDPACIDKNMRGVTVFRISFKSLREAHLELVCRAASGNSPLAQIPLSLFAGMKFLQTITLTGAQTEWERFCIDIPLEDMQGPLYLKFFFGQAGMEIQSITLYFAK